MVFHGFPMIGWMTIWQYPCCWTPFKHGWWVQRFNSCRKVENVPRRHFGQQLYLLQGRWREGVSSDGRNPMCIGNELQFIQPIYIWLVVWNIFPYIGNNHPNWLIFFRGVETTNQIYIDQNLVSDCVHGPMVSQPPQIVQILLMYFLLKSVAISGADLLEVSTIHKVYVRTKFQRIYLQILWLYLVQYLQFRCLKWLLIHG